MKRNKTYSIIFACLLMAGGLLTACSEDLGQTEWSATGEAVTFRVDMAGTAEVKTRADGEVPMWNSGDLFGIQSGSKCVAYRLEGSSLKPSDAGNTLWWESKNQSLSLSGWYYSGMTEVSAQSRPIEHSVQTDQSTAKGVAKSDFLYAPATIITYGQENTLSFEHRMAKLRVNVKYTGEISPDYPNQFEWLYRFDCKGSIAEDGTITAAGEQGIIITPMKLSTPTDGYDESYEFIVPAQTLPGKAAFAKFISGTDLSTLQCNLPDEEIKLIGSRVTTLNLTIMKAKVTVSVGSSIAWNAGNTGSGSVEIE